MLQINQWPSYKGVRPYIPLRSIKDIRTNLPFLRFAPPPAWPVRKQLEPYLKPFRSRLFIVVAAALINYKSYLNHFIILADYKRCWIILKMIFRMFMIWISRFFCFSLLLNWQIKNWYNKKKCSIERKDRMTLWYLLFTVGFFYTFTKKGDLLHRLDFPVLVSRRNHKSYGEAMTLRDRYELNLNRGICNPRRVPLDHGFTGGG